MIATSAGVRLSRTKGTAWPTSAVSAASAVAATKARIGSRSSPGRCTPPIVAALGPARQQAQLRDGGARVGGGAVEAQRGGSQGDARAAQRRQQPVQLTLEIDQRLAAAAQRRRQLAAAHERRLA